MGHQLVAARLGREPALAASTASPSLAPSRSLLCCLGRLALGELASWHRWVVWVQGLARPRSHLSCCHRFGPGLCRCG